MTRTINIDHAAVLDAVSSVSHEPMERGVPRSRTPATAFVTPVVDYLTTRADAEGYVALERPSVVAGILGIPNASAVTGVLWLLIDSGALIDPVSEEHEDAHPVALASPRVYRFAAEYLVKNATKPEPAKVKTAAA